MRTICRSGAPAVVSGFPDLGVAAPPAPGSRVIRLPCGHEITVPSGVSPMMLPASVGEDESGCAPPTQSMRPVPEVPGLGPVFGLEHSPFATATLRRGP